MSEKYYKPELKSSHFKTLEELKETCKYWIVEEDYDAYDRFFDFGCMEDLINHIGRLEQKEQDLIKYLEDEITEYNQYLGNEKIEGKLDEALEILGKLKGEKNEII